jgi:hypothetical protein
MEKKLKVLKIEYIVGVTDEQIKEIAKWGGKAYWIIEDGLYEGEIVEAEPKLVGEVELASEYEWDQETELELKLKAFLS